MTFKGHRLAFFGAAAILAAASFAGKLEAGIPGEAPVGVFDSDFNEKAPAVAYNFRDDEFLVVCVLNDTVRRNHDIYGQFVKPDGSLRGGPFPICSHPDDQLCPDVAYGVNNEFIVVWCDDRAAEWDIYGARLDASGMKLKNANTVGDTTFIVCDQDSSQYNPRIAHNPVDNNYLTVWRDYRNSFHTDTTCIPCQPLGKVAGLPANNADVYGQRLSSLGLLIAPGEPAGTKVNFPIAVDAQSDEYSQDVAYCGGGNRPDEWLVVYLKNNISYDLSGIGLVYGLRIDGKTGNWLDTWGNAHAPAYPYSPAGPTDPPWMPHFPLGAASGALTTQSISQSGPHVESNTGWLLHTGGAAALNPYPLAECLVTWTEFDYPAAVRAQRVAYFADSTAFMRGFKTARGADGMFTLVPVDSMGHPAGQSNGWIDWRSLLVSKGAYEKDFCNIAYNPVSGDYFVTWNDWKSSAWDGTFENEGAFIAPQADIAGKRLYLNPRDSSIVFLDRMALLKAASSDPIPVAETQTDEGNSYYPGIAYGYAGDQFLVAYEWEQDSDDKAIDVQGAFFKGATTAVKDLRPHDGKAPAGSILASNYPNPFNPGTTIAFRVPSAGRTVVRVMDGLGREVASLMDEFHQPGLVTARWEGTDAAGNPAASGVYYYEVLCGPNSARGKMLLLR